MAKMGAKDGYQSCPQPLGLETIGKLCGSLYADQPNPLQITALVKYWLGGPDPLDYITIYHHKATSKAVAHWHYVSCGFSDLHGDGRVHDRAPSPDQPSGFGFELTFRLHGDCSSSSAATPAPPTWPAELLQSLARYVFSSGNLLCAGDHISWHSALDNQESLIRHMILAPEPQLPAAKSALGTLRFLQIVGVTAEEVGAAQAWNGTGILKLMKTSPVCGGELLVTDMRRGESLFEAVPNSRSLVDEGVAVEGSLLSGVSAQCGWWTQGRTETNTFEAPGLPTELCEATALEKVNLKFDTEALQLWPLAIRGRLNHGRHFTFRSPHADGAITFVSDGIEGALATADNPFVTRGSWLQVYLGKEQGKSILQDIEQLLLENTSLGKEKRVSLPVVLEWPALHLKVTVVA